MARRFAVSALATWAAAAASVALAAPPTYTYVELDLFDGSTIPALELSLNDRGEIAWSVSDAFENERLYVRNPQGFLWNPATAGATWALTDLSLGKLGDDGTVAYTVNYASPDSRFQSVVTWQSGSPVLEIASVLLGSAQSFELAPDRNDAGQLAFWRAAASYGVMRWTAPKLEEDLGAAGFMSKTLIAPDGELFFERRATVLSTASVIYRGQGPTFTPFVSASDFGGVGRVNVAVDLNAAKTLLFRRLDTVGVNVYFKPQAGTATLVAPTATCGDPEINDLGQIMCATTTGIGLRNTSDLDPHTVVAPSAMINGTAIEAIGTVASLNDLGQVAFTARLANGVAGIYLATPNTCDSDGDGWCDFHDVCPTFPETTQRDTDQDGLGDRCDNCPFHANPDQADSNGDGRGNVCGPCLGSGFPRCGTRVKGAGNDVFTLANVPISALPPRPALYLLATTLSPGIVLEATVTGCVGGHLNANGSPVATYDGDGFQRLLVYYSYEEQADRVGATCSLEFRATGAASGTYTWLAESVTIGLAGGQTFYDSDGSETEATATAPNRATFTNETANHRFLYAGSGGQNFGTCTFVPDPPTAQEPSVAYSPANGTGWDCCTFQFEGFDGVPSSVGQLVFDVNQAPPPPPDPDHDGFLSPCDSCANLFNTDQADRGRVGPGAGEGIGDACQCTELTGDGSVGDADVTRLREHLAAKGAALSATALARCSAIGGPNECTVRTLAVLRRALLAFPPGVAQVCDAAVP